MIKKTGFTLIEALLSMALLAIITMLAIPVGQRFYTRNNLDTATHSLVQIIRRAQTFSSGSLNDSSWGVFIASPNILIFKGESFAGRNKEFDEIFELPNTINISGIDELVFEKMSGMPKKSGNITLTNSDGESKTISISPKGTLSY